MRRGGLASQILPLKIRNILQVYRIVSTTRPMARRAMSTWTRVDGPRWGICSFPL